MTLSLLNAQFVAVLTLIVLLGTVVPLRFRHIYGALVSAGLVAFVSLSTLAVILGITLFWIYPISRLIRTAKHDANQKAARGLFALGVVGLLSVLVIYKLVASQSFALPLFTISALDPSVITVIGISYFFFRGVSVLYMQYLGDLEKPSPFILTYYALFPSTLTSGPIQKYTDFQQQTSNPKRLSTNDLYTGVYRITQGFFMKLCVASILYAATERLLAAETLNAFSSAGILAGTYLGMFFDFAGYSHIAIGFGLLLGIRVPENFRAPFSSTSLTEFWRNWHITLVDCLRDMLFIPFGGMRGTVLKAAMLSFMIMALCGLWHGFTWLFLGWGVYHGVILFIEGVLGFRPLPPAQRHGFTYWRKIFITNLLVAIGCIFFLDSPETIQRVSQGFMQW